MISYSDWPSLEELLMRLRVGYQVQFDDHHGVAEMLININTIGIMRWEDGVEPGIADWSVSEAKPIEIEEGI
jgi:hypothetical protein